MVKAADKLAALERLARLKAERELQKFAAFSTHMAAARQRVDAMQAALSQSYASTAPLSLSEARMANAQAGRAARELRRADAELARLTPRFEAARQEAAREFGRAEVLLELARRESAQAVKIRY
ncbi:hypothetical protein [Paracoccus spongiarum]|uniref:Flagellar export protein FliJ n=1 Tax=Paracoccus spongiarum TaxID=3064387 RepID=A0ABT9JG12_9RHOB|nr:hypothetical protein [Paracoccus sp. 2205BS29-5]MDP5308565.1 hypothetical protein [Paracoccus sp. 2205BS29-5]